MDEHHQIDDGLCKILHRLWSKNVNDAFCLEDSVDNLQPYTVDGVPIRKLFIGNIAQRTTNKDLQKLFSTYGKLDSCYLKRNSGKSNYAFVTFNSIDDALEATKDGHRKRIHLHNRDLRVMPADSWHQPDSIENQNKKSTRNSVSSVEISSEFILNEDSEIHKLNDDCLMHIFQYLPIIDRIKMERVCKRWRNVSRQSWRTFKKLDLSLSKWGFSTSIGGPREIDTPTLRKVLLRCGQFLTHLDISSYAEKLSKSTLTVVGKQCPNLQYIDVTALNVSPAGLKALAAHCSNIVEFSLGHCTSTCDNDLSILFSKNKKIRSLKLIQNSISGKCLLNLPVDTIEELILDDCNNVSPCQFYNAIQKLHKLRTLSLEKCISFNDQALKGISLCSKNLTELHLCHDFPMISLNAMSCIGELVNLVILDVSHNITVKDQFLKVIGEKCKQLKVVDISSCHLVTSAGLASITSLPHLEHLSINYLGEIDDEVLSDMPKLRSMECRGCPSLKNAGLCILIEEAHNIELLDFSGCNEISNELVEVAIKSTLNRTNNIVLKMFVGNTSVDMTEIKKVSPFLQVLNVDLSEMHLRPDYEHDFFPDEILEFEDYYDSVSLTDESIDYTDNEFDIWDA